ncbi:MAG TPA: hypothetical protein VHZ52_07655 [Acidobacteriaceae bacterium]|jgi:hypothetical protein|nr:hypothetical protein [Acidobacteriaceae bacterium]
MTTVLKDEYRAPSHVAEAGAPAIVVAPGALVGTWHNVNAATRDLVKIVIAAARVGVTVNPFGACTPTPCNWGVVPGVVYSANVSSSAAEAFSAEFNFGFSRVTVVGHLVRKELLVETFTVFTDGSGRANLYTADTMVK